MTHIFFHKQHISSSSSSSSTTSFSDSMKLRTLLHTLIFSRLYRIARAVAKAKTILLELLREVQTVHLIRLTMATSSPAKNLKGNSKSGKSNSKFGKSNSNQKLFLGSFRLHYNWCSSHVAPAPPDATWDCSFVPSEAVIGPDDDEGCLSGYLRWLEEEAGTEGGAGEDIDRLADMFIANSHERFRLEKVESYRRFQEMLARSV